MTAADFQDGSPSPGAMVAEAVSNLRAQGRRSVLALLGILIGTASIITMLNTGHIAQTEALKAFEGVGVDMMRAQISSTSASYAGFPPAEIDDLARRDPDIVQAIPFGLGSLSVGVGTQRVNLSVVAMTPELVALNHWRAGQGRLLRQIDGDSLVAVIGPQAARSLSTPGADVVPGSFLRLGNYVFTVVGVLAPQDGQMLDPADYNNSVLIPMEAAQRALAGAEPNGVLLRLRPEADPVAVGERLKASLARPQSIINIVNAKEMLANMKKQQAIFTSLLAAIGGVSLFVGGIGVMNVMLMSVMERRREIGLRASIGATPRAIQLMFLIEAATLSVIGGLGGLLLGALASAGLAALAGWPFSLALYVLPLALGMAGLVGVAFGLNPAIMASRLDPIEALRAE